MALDERRLAFYRSGDVAVLEQPVAGANPKTACAPVLAKASGCDAIDVSQHTGERPSVTGIIFRR
jgi:hypothetical protein